MVGAGRYRYGYTLPFYCYNAAASGERFDKDRDETAHPRLKDFKDNLCDVLNHGERRC